MTAEHLLEFLRTTSLGVVVGILVTAVILRRGRKPDRGIEEIRQTTESGSKLRAVIVGTGGAGGKLGTVSPASSSVSAIADMKEIERLRAYVARLERRLEIDRFHDENGNEFSVPPEGRQTFPDGIECRDATIRLLRDEIEILRNQWEQAKQKIAKMTGGGSV